MSSALTAAATSGMRATLGAYPQSAPVSSPVVVSSRLVTTPTVPVSTPPTVPSSPPSRPAWAGEAVVMVRAAAVRNAAPARCVRRVDLRTDMEPPHQVRRAPHDQEGMSRRTERSSAAECRLFRTSGQDGLKGLLGTYCWPDDY